MREVWESVIRDVVRHLYGTNRADSTQRIHWRAALGLVEFLQWRGDLPGPQGLKWLQAEEEIDRSPMTCMRPPIVPAA